MPKPTASPAYVPGVCNINRAEIARRRNSGYLGLVLFAILLALYLAFGVSRWYHLLLFFPALLAALGFLQARNKFCVSFAASGVQNASEGSSTASSIADKKARAADKRKARQMNLSAGTIAVIVALLTLLIPR